MSISEETKEELDDLFEVVLNFADQEGLGVFDSVKKYISDFTKEPVLALLKQHEGLAKAYMEEYLENPPKECNTLIYFVLANCNLETIQELYRRLRSDPRWLAEETNSFEILVENDTLLEFLVSSAHAVFDHDDDDALIVERAFYQAQANAETEHEKIRSLKMFLDIFWTLDWWACLCSEEGEITVENDYDEGYKSIFGSILSGRFGAAVMHYFFGEFFGPIPNRNPLLLIKKLKISAILDFGHPQASALSMMLPNLTNLHLEPGSWTPEGVLCLLRALKGADNLEKLGLSLPASVFPNDGSIEEAFQEMFAMNESLESLEICHGWENSESDDKFLKAILDALVHNSSVQHLYLTDLVLNNTRQTSQFLSKCKVSSIELSGVIFKGGLDVNWSFLPECQLRSVCIIFCEREDQGHLSCYKHLIYQLDKIPLLEDLTIQYSKIFKRFRDHPREFRYCETSPDFTEQIVSASSRGNLKRLALKYVEMDARALDKTLQKNKHLEQLDVYDLHQENNDKAALACVARNIEHTNFRLSRIVSADPDISRKNPLCGRIAYFADLNLFGREKAVSETVTLSQFVDLLRGANEFEDPDGSTCSVGRDPWEDHLHNIQRSRWEVRVHNILFGLLSSAPEAWCNV